MPDPEREALNDEQRKRRRKLLRRAIDDLSRVLDNSEGIERLRNLSDEEWDAAAAESEGESDAA